MKGILFRIPLFGFILKHSGHISVIAGNGRPAFEQAKLALQKGKSVIVFIEGGTSPSETGYHKPKTGAVRLSLVTGEPIVPVGFALNYEKLKQTKTVIGGQVELASWYYSGPYYITLGKPLYIKGSLGNHSFVRGSSARVLEIISILAEKSKQRLIFSKKPDISYFEPIKSFLVRYRFAYINHLILVACYFFQFT